MHCKRGPLGFPVVDVAVTLLDGSYHTVDSSDMAFRAAARLGVSEALPKARPVLLEPILAVDVLVPSEAVSRASGIVSSRRGQILGYEPRDGWEGWDVLKALIPEAEIGDLIIELPFGHRGRRPLHRALRSSGRSRRQAGRRRGDAGRPSARAGERPFLSTKKTGLPSGRPVVRIHAAETYSACWSAASFQSSGEPPLRRVKVQTSVTSDGASRSPDT